MPIDPRDAIVARWAQRAGRRRRHGAILALSPIATLALYAGVILFLADASSRDVNTAAVVCGVLWAITTTFSVLGGLTIYGTAELCMCEKMPGFDEHGAEITQPEPFCTACGRLFS